MLNPELNRAELTARFREDDRVRVAGLLKTADAESLRDACIRSCPYDVIFTMGGNNYAQSEADIQGLSSQQRREMQASIAADARKGIGFLYGGYKLGSEDRETGNADLKLLHSVFDYLNSDEMLDFVREVTGDSTLKSADAQYTRYLPGHFLTRHRDDIRTEGRRFAYVLSLSKNWHPDWGGLLQFFEDGGTPRDAWLPQFNTMALFDVRHVHSVTYLTPFAGEPRYSLTGWFRDRV